ncbi:39S ribosomal protein L50, mitochondrial [Aplysia californica]|uniref:Large ribosomal subunit protein mL50 n=1 Tax=Aplysia californica TaxID=6500 RepID=A0ABM0JE31_APLCA|nr:39S ribosomal protein L50, mitochondrial [Aplysia californica]
MATTMNKAVLGLRATGIFQGRSNKCLTWSIAQRSASWTKFFRGSKSKDDDEDKEVLEVKPRKVSLADGPTTAARLGSLEKKIGVVSVRGYSPPQEVEGKILSTAKSLVGSDVSTDFRLDDRMLRFKLLTSLMQEFDHSIPNTELTAMSTLSDVITFFSTPVRDRSSYEDMSTLNLPKNLHIQLEPLRFSADSDTFFDGKTAFPDRPTVVSSLKYSRKFKGNEGESRNQPSLTNFEKEKMLQEDREIRRRDILPSEGRKRRPNTHRQIETEVPFI